MALPLLWPQGTPLRSMTARPRQGHHHPKRQATGPGRRGRIQQRGPCAPGDGPREAPARSSGLGGRAGPSARRVGGVRLQEPHPGPPPGRGRRGAAGHFQNLPVPGPHVPCGADGTSGRQLTTSPSWWEPRLSRRPYVPQLPACAPPRGASLPGHPTRVAVTPLDQAQPLGRQHSERHPAAWSPWPRPPARPPAQAAASQATGLRARCPAACGARPGHKQDRGGGS